MISQLVLTSFWVGCVEMDTPVVGAEEWVNDEAKTSLCSDVEPEMAMYVNNGTPHARVAEVTSESTLWYSYDPAYTSGTIGFYWFIHSASTYWDVRVGLEIDGSEIDAYSIPNWNFHPDESHGPCAKFLGMQFGFPAEVIPAMEEGPVTVTLAVAPPGHPEEEFVKEIVPGTVAPLDLADRSNSR